MILELVLAILVGVLAGTITGILPSIHINLVSALIVSWLPRIAGMEPIIGAVFISSLAVTHTAIDFIPSIYLGAPNDETALAVLPAHHLLKLGQGHEAALLALKGSVTGLFIALFLAPIIILFSPMVIKNISSLTPFIIIFIVSYMLLREKRIVSALISFFLAGLLGYLSLNIPVKEPLLPLLSGLFGASGLIISLKDKTNIIEQKTKKEIHIPKTSKKDITIYSVIGSVFSILPALGSGYASLVTSEVKEKDNRKFIYSVGLMNMLIMVSSFPFVYATEKSRTGAAAAISNLITSPNIFHIIIILFTCTVSGISAYFIGKKISEKSSKYIARINYKIISILALLSISATVLIFSNLLGFLVFLTGTAIGIFTITSEVKRTNMMGCLIVPTLLYYLF